MHLFWRYGYENTSMQMLEKEMGINKFSISSSFGSKHGVFTESLKSYKRKVRKFFDTFKNGENGVEDIKDFFYNSITICNEEGNQKGCLIASTYNEFYGSEDKIITSQMANFIATLRELIIEKLKKDGTRDSETIIKQTNFLLLAKNGLALASRVNNQQEIEDYIELTFKNI